jgi:hypothetical protein
MAVPNIPNIISEIAIPRNRFIFGTDKHIHPYPCQYEFYNKYVEKVILPSEINILDLKKYMFEEIIFYKFNNFNFNYHNSFFIKIFQELFTLLQTRNLLYSQQIKILQIVSLLNRQLDSFNTKLDSLLELLQSITTSTIELDLLNLLDNQRVYYEQLQHILIQYTIIQNPQNNYDNKLVALQTKLVSINRKIIDINVEINRIGLANRPNIQDIDSDKENKIKNYLSNFILLDGLFNVIQRSYSPNNPIRINNDEVSTVENEVKKKFKKLYDYNKYLNKIYREKDLQIITNNLDKPTKQIERDELLKTAIFNKTQLFGHYEPAQYKRVFLPYYISVENIIELIKLRINGELTQEQLNILIYNYNTFQYFIHIGDETNKNYYMTRNSITTNKNYFRIQIDDIRANLPPQITQYSYRITAPAVTQVNTQPIYIYIPITQEINKIYDDVIKKYFFEYNIIPKGLYLKSYNKKKNIIINNISINLQTKTYNFNYDDDVNPAIDVEIPLYDLIKNEKIKTTALPLTYFYTDYNYKSLPPVQDISINILDFYEDIDEKKIINVFGNIQSAYNLYILFEQLKTKMNLDQEKEKYIEDYILCLFELFNENINSQFIPPINNRIIQPLIQLFNPLLTEQYYFYMNEKSKEIIYKEINRGIVMIRLICIIIYIARIYPPTSNLTFQNYIFLENSFKAYLKNPNLLNNFVTSIIDFFESNIQLRKINAEFITSIIDGSLFSKEKYLFNKKQNILESSIETATETIENIASEMDTFVHKDSLINDFSLQTIKKSANDAVNYMFNKKEDYTTEPVNITNFENKNFSLTADVIQNRVKKWITGPIYDIPDWMPYIDVNNINKVNNKIVCPDVIQFIGEYLNNNSETDLISIKNKEQICKNISSLKDTIEKNTSQIKYILPKTFFDDEYFMTKYLKRLDEPNTKKNN